MQILTFKLKAFLFENLNQIGSGMLPFNAQPLLLSVPQGVGEGTITAVHYFGTRQQINTDAKTKAVYLCFSSVGRINVWGNLVQDPDFSESNLKSGRGGWNH